MPDGQAADMVAADANTVAGDNDDSDNDNDNDNDNGSDSATVTLPRVLRIDDAVPLLEVCAGNVVVFVWLFLYGCVCVCVCASTFARVPVLAPSVITCVLCWLYVIERACGHLSA